MLSFVVFYPHQIWGLTFLVPQIKIYIFTSQSCEILFVVPLE